MFGLSNKKNRQLLDELNEKYENGLDNKVDAERNALINVNFINGKQYLTYDREKGLFKSIDIEGEQFYRERGVFNRIKPIRNTVLAKIHKEMPIPQALPIKQDDADLDAALATNAMLRDFYIRQKIEKKLKKVSQDMVDKGPAFLHVSWDKNAGHILLDDVDAMLGDMSAIISFEDKEKIKEQLNSDGKVRSGDVSIENVSLFEIIVPNPYEEDIQEQEWIMRVKAYTPEDAKNKFGKDFKDLETIGQITMTKDKSYGSSNKDLINNLGIYNTKEQKEMVVMKEYFQKPCTEYPDGRYILFGGEHIIKEVNELPYINGEYGSRMYPFIKFGLSTPDLFYSHAFLESTKEIQKRYNDTHNRKFEYITNTTHGQLLIQEGSIADEEEITNKPGSIMRYKRGFAEPKIVHASGQGSMDADSELRALNGEFVNVVGISTLSTTGAPNSSAVRGAGMVEQLMESDDSKLSLITNVLIEGTIEMCKQVVRLYKQFMMPNEVRFTQFTEDLQTVVEWKHNMLMENIDIKNKTKLSMTDARRKEEVMMLLQSGLLDPSATQLGAGATIKLIEQMSLGISIDEMPIKGYADVKKARRENRIIATNPMEIDADEYDDHATHFEVHTNYIKSDEYRKKVIANHLIDEAMRAHIEQHAQVVQSMQQAARAEAEAQQKMKG